SNKNRTEWNDAITSSILSLKSQRAHISLITRPQFPWRNMLEKKEINGIPPVKSSLNTRAGTRPYARKSLFAATGERVTEYKNASVQAMIRPMVISGGRRLGIVSLNGIIQCHPLLSSPPVRVFRVLLAHRPFMPRGHAGKLPGGNLLTGPARTGGIRYAPAGPGVSPNPGGTRRF